jgi:predicted metal-dependent hydrolase
VQLRLPLSGDLQSLSGPVVFIRHPRARRYILRVLPDGTVRVTVPRRGVKRDAQAFVAANQAWIAEQRARRQQTFARVAPWRHGTSILVDGRLVDLRVTAQPGGGTSVWCGDAVVGRRDCIPSDLRPMIEAWLRRRATRELPPLLLALGEAHGISVPRVSVRDQRSRWGACAPTGTITLNWRLIQVPLFVREYVLLHELMHRRELNHSRRFWALVAACCPRHDEARHWLREEGKQLWRDRE